MADVRVEDVRLGDLATRQDLARIEEKIDSLASTVGKLAEDMRAGFNLIMGEVSGLKAWREQINPKVARLVEKSERT